MTRHSLFAPVLISCLTLAACAGTDPGSDAGPSGSTVTTTVTPAPVTVTQASTSRAPGGIVTTTVTAPAPSSTPTPPPPEECVTDVRRSDFQPWIEAGRIPLGTLGEHNWEVEPADGFYHFRIKDSGYDSCRTLSWVSLTGTNGDETRTGSVTAETMVFFHYGELITNPAPFEMTSVEDVRRTSDFSIRVIYGHAGGATAGGGLEQYLMNFYYDNGLSGSGELPEGVDSHVRLNLTGS